MAAAFQGPITAVHVGNAFVMQYYRLLQLQPMFVHHFYNETSTMLRVDNALATAESAAGTMQIHNAIMSLNFVGIEIRTANYLDSWGGGILVMVSGSALTKNYNAMRKFVQTFFLAPQEKGYFVLNDVFYFLDEEHIPQHSSEPDNLEPSFNESGTNAGPAYRMRGLQSRKPEAAGADSEAFLEEYDISEFQRRDSVPVDDAPIEEQADSPRSLDSVQESSPVPAEESIGEPPKQTYASILRIAKGPNVNTLAHPSPSSKTSPVASEWHQAAPPINQSSQLFTSSDIEKSNSSAVEDIPSLEYEGDAKSVYIGNLPMSVSAFDLEHEFSKFGPIKANGVAVRNRKDSSGCYAFVEFEDSTGVQNALQASPAQINGRKIYIEERRSSNNTARGARRGRGRGNYPLSDTPRGRVSARLPSRTVLEVGGTWDYNGGPNGFHPRASHRERGILGHHSGRLSHRSTGNA